MASAPSPATPAEQRSPRWPFQRSAYADNKTLVVVVADSVRYNELIQVMDTAITAGLDGLSVSGTPL